MNRSDGLWIYSERSDSLELVYHYPTYAGDWYAFFDYGVITRVISTDTVICLGQECYRCYCYLLDYQFGEKEYYFLAPGIGLVMHEKNLITNAQPFGPLALRVRTDLVKYHIE